MTNLLRAITFLAIAIGFAHPCLGAPIRIAYLATDLPDSAPGEDRWEYRYVVSDFSFDVDRGFAIAFDSTLYTDLESIPPPVGPDWDVVTFQPDPVLGSPGLYDALALVSGASLLDPFVVSFTWLGGALPPPGSQPFTVHEFGPGGLLTIIETGRTEPFAQPVPEPATSALVVLGAAGALWKARRSRRGAGERP